MFGLFSSSGVRTSPRNAKVQYNYANVLRQEGKTSNAIWHYMEALRYSTRCSFSKEIFPLSFATNFSSHSLPPLAEKVTSCHWMTELCDICKKNLSRSVMLYWNCSSFKSHTHIMCTIVTTHCQPIINHFLLTVTFHIIYSGTLCHWMCQETFLSNDQCCYSLSNHKIRTIWTCC